MYILISQSHYFHIMSYRFIYKFVKHMKKQTIIYSTEDIQNKGDNY